MHKKPLVAVIILGLLLLTPSTSFAAKDPGSMLTDQNVEILPRVARQLDKGPLGASSPYSGTPSALQMGVSRGGATVCDGDGYGGFASFYGNWFFGDEFYANFQDPENFGSCSGGSDLYTFDVTEIDWFILDQNGVNLVFDAQPLVFENGGDALCPVPGGVLCAGPLYNIDLTGGGAFNAYVLGLPFPTECCVYDPYFAGVYVPTVTGTGEIGIIFDNDGATSCFQYNEYGLGWVDLTDDIGFAGDVGLWSEGFDFAQNTCPGTPGICDWQFWTDGSVVNLWADPNANNQTDYFVRFTAAVSCTLQKAQVIVYTPAVVGTPTLRVRVYGNNGPVFGGLMYPDLAIEGANFLGSVDVPFASLNAYPAYTEVDLTSLGPLSFGPSEVFFVTVSRSPLTPAPGSDVIAFLSDTPNGGGLGPDPHSGSWADVPAVPIPPDFYYFGDIFGSGQRELYVEAFLCCEQVDLAETPCAAPGPDDWNTWAHDYQRTSASSMELGDPCQVNAEWYQPLNTLANFTEPTIAGDRVYANTDNRLTVYDLQTGAPGAFIAGIPHIFGSNRGNTTVEGGFAYVTGGTARSIGQWTADLTVNNWVNGLPALGAGPLSANDRFGVTAIFDVAGTDVIVVGDDNGRLYAYDASTGALFPGWGTNPLILAGAALHSPAYDGVGTLYVGTAAAASNTAGPIYSIDAATGAINWTYDDANLADEGYPGGVSYEAGFIYASSNAGGNVGRRVKLDATGAEVWNFGQARSLYGAPTIGRTFLYIGQDVGGQGVLAVDKASGAALYNFALDGVGDVTQHVTLLCDNYLFAGDRNGHWWLLDVNDFTPEWYFSFFGIVNGTAIGEHSVSGDGFAVVSVRTDASPSAGGLAAFRFNAGTRPRIRQDVFLSSIPVPFGTGPGTPYTETAVVANVGCEDLTITGFNIYDPLPDVAASNFRRSQEKYADAQAALTVGPDYTAYFDKNTMTKRERLAYNQVMPMVDHEFTTHTAKLDDARATSETSKRAENRMAAGASIVRTSAVAAVTPVVPAGGATDISWLYDGTGLERGLDVELIEILSDDPDLVIIADHHPVLEVDYIGGCLPESAELHWNTLGNENIELVYNTGHLGDDDADDDFIWGDDPIDPEGNIYEAGIFLAGDSSTAGVQWHIASIYDGTIAEYARLFLPNPLASLGGCGIDGDADVHMGWKRTGGCPGTPEEIQGAWARSAYIDTNEAAIGELAAIGTIITQTEVGAYDPLYGDFKLIRWELENRDAVAKGPLYLGSYVDWDVHDAYGDNHGIASAGFNGYAIWDWTTPGYAYGMLDPNQPSNYTGVDPSAFPPNRVQEMGQDLPGGPNAAGAYGLWQTTGPGNFATLWTDVVNGAAVESGPHDTGLQEDHAGLLVHAGLNLPASGTAATHAAIFGVDASSNNPAVVEALATALAARAAKWGGFARGDVNDDGVINLVDVCWLMSANQIYPDDYNGDVDVSGGVDAADEAYLLNYVSGLGPAPQGEWRFTF